MAVAVTLDLVADPEPSTGVLSPDPASRRWLRELRADGPMRDDAVARLHALLVRAARFEVRRRRAGLSSQEREELAASAAGDALVAVLRKLDEYAGRSRFTTWAAKFALYEAAVQVRRRSFREREVATEPERWPTLEAATDDDAREMLDALRRCLPALTDHQRRVFVALALNDVPIDVLADRWSTTRGALYKALHDARRRLRQLLADEGFEVGTPQKGGSR
jgi:RNA polymerase sigma-70 factor (ECF subfamily)